MNASNTTQALLRPIYPLKNAPDLMCVEKNTAAEKAIELINQAVVTRANLRYAKGKVHHYRKLLTNPPDDLKDQANYAKRKLYYYESLVSKLGNSLEIEKGQIDLHFSNHFSFDNPKIKENSSAICLDSSETSSSDSASTSSPFS